MSLERPTIRTPDQRLRVFVSSTLGELSEERKAASEAISNMRLAPVLFELGARPHPPKDLYRAYLAQSHIFIGIYWERYGWVAPDMDISGLEDEYRLSGDMPKLIHVKRPAPNQEARLIEMLTDIRDRDAVSYKSFSDATELRALIQDDLALLLTESFESSDRSHGTEDETSQAPKARCNLPADATLFVGRTAEARRLHELLDQDDVRLVTVTGPGGIGKTRLALELGRSSLGSFPDGVWLVKLSPITDPNLIVPEIGRVVEAPDRAEGLSAAALQEHIADRKMLLILDNFEHLVTAAPLVGELLAACPNLKILVTSRAVLHLRGEYEFAAPTMHVPEPGAICRPDTWMSYESVRLFDERARASNPRFELTSKNCEAVFEICRRLDGLPLALELAAARTKLLSPEAMLRRMDNQLQLLTGGARDVPERQRTLRAALDWDYDLLSAEEQALFRGLAVFSGGFTFDSAEAVINGGDDVWVDVFEGIDSLAGKSLIRRESDPGDADLRFGTLKVIREYATERLNESGESSELHRRLLGYLLELAERAEGAIRDPEGAGLLDGLEREHDNIRAALKWASENDPRVQLQLAGALGSFWAYRSFLTEGRYWLDLGLKQVPDASADLRARALVGAGTLARAQGDYDRAEQLLKECLEITRPLGDELLLSRALKNLGNVYIDTDRLEPAMSYYQEGMEVARRLGDRRGVADISNNLGVLARMEDDWTAATVHYEESLDIFRELKDEIGAARVLMNLGEARLEAGDHAAAARHCKESLGIFYDQHSHWDIADVLEVLAAVATARSDPREAARLFGAAEALREALKTPLPPSERQSYEVRVLDARTKLDGTEFALAWSVGRAMNLEEAVEHALGH